MENDNYQMENRKSKDLKTFASLLKRGVPPAAEKSRATGGTPLLPFNQTTDCNFVLSLTNFRTTRELACT
jgi:hypothetical protein